MLEQQRANLRTVAVNDDEIVARRGQSRESIARLADRGALLGRGSALISPEDRVAAEGDDEPHGSIR